MHKKQWPQLAALAIFVMFAGNARALPVIPGAVGFGTETPAGRGGKIIRVTNLNDSGSGSLRACVNASGPRICVFEVSGTIRLKSNLTISEPYITIAGQTAPSPGIMLRGWALKVAASNVLIQHIASRVGDATDGPDFKVRDSLKIVGDEFIENIVIDHCSFSWGVDETVEVYRKWDNVTISNTIISEGLRESRHPSGPHGLGVLILARRDDTHMAMIGNLMAHHWGRNPRSNAAEFVLVNNVVYNAKEAETILYNEHGLTTKSTVIGNVYIPGRDSWDGMRPVKLVGETKWGTALLRGSKVYLEDNVSPYATDDPWSVVDNRSGIARSLLEALSVLSWPDRLEAMPGKDVVKHVLANAGTRPADRNEVDARIVADVKNGTGRIINCVGDDGSSRCKKNAGGWPKMAENHRSLSIPDNPNGDDDKDGYTNVEEWLHDMAAQVEGRVNSEGDPREPVSVSSPPEPPQLHD